MIDKNLSSISMGNLLGREGRRCEKKEKKKEEKRRRGEIKTSILGEGRQERIQNNSTTPTKHLFLFSSKRILNNITLIHHTHKLLLFLKRILLLLHISGRRGRGGRRGRRVLRGTRKNNKKKQVNLWERKRMKKHVF